MQSAKKQITKKQLFSLIEQYSAGLAERGIQIKLHFVTYKNRLIRSNEEEYKQRFRGFFFDCKAVITGDFDLESDEALEQADFVTIPCIVLSFSPIGYTSNISGHVQYAFPLRKRIIDGTRPVRADKIMRSMERILKRKQIQLKRYPEKDFCKNAPWDYCRYAFGSYGYMETIAGKDRETMQILCLSPLIFLLTVLIIILFCL